MSEFYYICPYIFGGNTVETHHIYRNLTMLFAFCFSESACIFYAFSL